MNAYKPSGWYRQRNEKIYEQAKTFDLDFIARYWQISVERVRYVINAEAEKRANAG